MSLSGVSADSLNAAEVMTLGQHYDEDGQDDGPITFQEAAIFCGSLSLIPLEKAIVVSKAAGPLTVQHMPFRPMTGTTKIKTFVDIVLKANAAFDKEELVTLTHKGESRRMVAPFKPKMVIEDTYIMQTIVVPDDDGNTKVTVVKHYVFDKKIDVRLLEKMAWGQPHAIDYGSNFRAGTKAVQRMMSGLGGWQIAWFVLKPVNTKVRKTRQRINSGFQHIRKNSPKTSLDNAIIEWTETELADSESPIFGWSAGLVKESIKSYRSSAMVATKTTFFPLHMRNIAGWFLDDVLIPYVLKYLFVGGLVQIGEPGKGKTPIAEILAFQLSLYSILEEFSKTGQCSAEVAYKITSNMDFLRGEPGSKFLPIVVDDLDLPAELMARIKALLSVGEVKSLTYQRWSASCFVQGQPRMVNANQYDAEAERDPGVATAIPHASFFAMVRPAFHEKATSCDIMAVFKRAVVVLTTKLGVYARVPNGEEVEVPFIRFGQKTDFLEDGAKEVYRAYKKGDRTAPCGWIDGLQWGQALLTMALTTRETPSRTKVCAGESATDPTTHVNTEIKPSIMNDSNHLILTDINKFVLVQSVTR